MNRTKRRLGRPESDIGDEQHAAGGFSLIGPGAVGSALARSLVQSGFRFLTVIGRHPDRTEAAGNRLKATNATTDLRGIAPDTNLVFVCVPDDVLPVVVGILSATDRDWTGTVFAHTSGLLDSTTFEPLAHRGAAVLSFHPLRAFRPGGELLFKDCVVTLEGDEMAVAIGEVVARDIGARPVPIRRADKPLYHAAASVASNYFVTLMDVAETLFEAAGLKRDDWLPLVESTWGNLRSTDPGQALTGPIVRGDVETVRRHLDALRKMSPGLIPVYIVLGSATVDLAVRAGRLDQDDADRILRLFDEDASVNV